MGPPPYLTLLSVFQCACPMHPWHAARCGKPALSLATSEAAFETRRSTSPRKAMNACLRTPSEKCCNTAKPCWNARKTSSFMPMKQTCFLLTLNRHNPRSFSLKTQTNSPMMRPLETEGGLGFWHPPKGFDGSTLRTGHLRRPRFGKKQAP